MARVAMTVGAIPIGASAVSGVSAAENQSNNEGGSTESNSQFVQLEEVSGKKRSQLTQEANNSTKVDFVADRLGGREEVTSVYKFTLKSGATGHGVIYGVGDRSEGSTIRYYKSDLHEDGSAAAGGKPSGDGIIGVRANDDVITHIHGTPKQKSAMSILEDNREYESITQELESGSLVEDEAIIVYDPSGSDEHTEINIPVENSEEITGRVVVSGPGWPSPENIDSYSIKKLIDGVDEPTTGL